jgi:tetratricopeptide (TPR) repeat protein
VYAGNTARYEQAYKDIADELDLPGRTEPAADPFKLVSRWLSNEANGQWLMILDNADNEEMFFREFDTTSAKAPLITSIPQTANGSVLITSRSETAAMNLLNTRENMIRVEVMDEKDALDLIRTKVALDDQSLRDARQLIKDLDNIPLAIIQASSYIAARSPRITVSDYLNLLREGEASLVTLLGKMDVRDPRRDYSSQQVVTATWQISFDQIRTSYPTSSDMLSLMSMFDRHGIPESLLQQDMTRSDFEDAVHPLISFSLIKQSKDQQHSFEIHRLVQVSIRKWLEANNQRELWVTRSAKLLAVTFPSGEFGTWAECQVLLPHAKEVLHHQPPENNATVNEGSSKLRLLQNIKETIGPRSKRKIIPDSRELLMRAKETIGHKASRYLSDQGKYEEALVILQHALKISKKDLGVKDSDTLVGARILGVQYDRKGRYDKAEELYRHSRKSSLKVAGLEHRNIFQGVADLSIALDRQGKYEEAERIHRHVLKVSLKVLGPGHPETLDYVNDLAISLIMQGKYDEAEDMYRWSLEGREKMLGLKHPETLESVYDVGTALYSQSKYDEAEAMYRRSLEGREEVLGPKHPETLHSVYKLGRVLDSQSKYDEAEAIYRCALEGREEVLGLKHPFTLISLFSLIEVLRRQGKTDEADALCERAFRTLEERTMEEQEHALED